ncbi:hypothetical protein FBUS_09067 [Fasciolopsis buskii]|uniref:Uncharacterized protein n=1 Tax=Fasciolopsis buskii TaxID=27845 RepID=A0A8E0RTD3_9TREM|nr:hypothetical protein FBUS_09067 [Fasciolopsis buski]
MDSFCKQSFAKRGQIETGTPRFGAEHASDFPGVGTYNWSEEPFTGSTVGLLSCGGTGERSLPCSVSFPLAYKYCAIRLYSDESTILSLI